MMPAIHSNYFSSFVYQRPFFWWFGLVLACNALAVWWPVWPFGQDSIAWIEMIDIVARYHDPRTLYATTYQFNLLFEPNTLALAAGWWSGGWLSATTIVRLWLTFYVVGTPLAALYLCWIYERPPWLGLLTAPLVFGMLYTVGLLNYLIGIPLILWSLGLARRYTREGGGWRGMGLALCMLLLFHSHLFGFLVGGALVMATILLSLRNRKGLMCLWIFCPSLLPFFLWFLRKFIYLEKTAEGMTFGTSQGGFGFVYRSLGQRIDAFHANGLGMFKDSVWDEGLFAVFITFFFLFFLIERYRQFVDTSPRSLGSFRADAKQWITSNGLGLLALCVLAGYLLLPSHMNNLYLIAERLVTLFLILLLLSQRITFEGKAKRLLVPMVAVSVLYPLYVTAHTSNYMQDRMGPLRSFFSQQPPKQRVHMVDLRPYNRTYPTRVLWHVIKSLNAFYTGGITDDNFARTPYNAVGYRRGKTPPPYKVHSLEDGTLGIWDLVVVRANTEPLAAKQDPRLMRVFHWRYWWIYRVKKTQRKGIIAHTAGGSGGFPNAWDCPKGHILRGFTGQKTDRLARILPVCRSLQDGKPSYGPYLGTRPHRGQNFSMLCGVSDRVVGIYGYADAFVRGWGILCGVPAPTTLRSDPSSKNRWGGILRLPPEGRVQGHWFERRCAKGQAAVGFRGRVGEAIDAWGIACAPM